MFCFIVDNNRKLFFDTKKCKIIKTNKYVNIALKNFRFG